MVQSYLPGGAKVATGEGRAHWRHLASTIELVLPSAHRSPQPKLQIDRFSRFCTAHGRKCLYFTMRDPFPQNCPFSWGGVWDPYPFHDSLRQTEPTIQTASRSVQLLSHRWPQSVPILYNGTLLSPSKLPLPMGDLDPRLIHGSLDPPKSSTQMALDRFSHFSRAH